MMDLETKELLTKVVKDFFFTFRDNELRTFVCGGDNTYDSERDLLKDLASDSNRAFTLSVGITNAIYAYLVAGFSEKMSIELAYANDTDKNSSGFCVEDIEDALFGLYDTYDATDDLVKFVVFNTALALGNDQKLQEGLGFDKDSSFAERPKERGAEEKENLLSIFRWMSSMRKLKTTVRVKVIAQHYKDTLKKLSRLLEYAAFFSKISLRSDGDSGSYNFVLESGRTIQTHFVILKNKKDFFLLRSVETEKNNETSILLKYTCSNTSENDTKSTWEMINADIAENASTDDIKFPRIPVKRVGETYSEITNGLIRKRSRSTFCGGLSGYKYYTELAASIIDAVEAIASSRTGKSVAGYLINVIKYPKNFSICKEECVCTRPACRMGNMKSCHGKKRFETPDDFSAPCLSNMRLLPIMTLLLIVAGTKSILPQVFSSLTENPDPQDFFKQINSQLSLRFTNYHPDKVAEDGEAIFTDNLAKSSLTLNIKDVDRLPKQLTPALNKLKARAYTEAIVKELERIENSFENKETSQTVGNIDNYSIKEMFDAMDAFRAESSDDTYAKDVKYAKQYLRQVLMTVLCFYKGLSECMTEQFEYEIGLENSMKDGAVNIARSSENIRDAFFRGVKDELIRLEGTDYLKNPRIPTFFDLFKEIKDLNDEENTRRYINMILGRDMLDARELFRIVHLVEDGKLCLIKIDGDMIGLDDDPDAENLPTFFRGIKEILGYFYNRNTDHGIGVYPQVLTFSSTMINRDGNIIRKFMFYVSEKKDNHRVREREYNVFTFFNYEINKRYFFVPPKKCENSNWLTHPILIGCSEFCEAVFGNLPKEKIDE